jgi:DNA replication protein DnaC
MTWQFRRVLPMSQVGTRLWRHITDWLTREDSSHEVPLCDFKRLSDWAWPKRCDRAAIEELMGLGFIQEAANAILVAPNGVGKSTLARNIAHQAVLAGHTVLCTSAGHTLAELAGADGDRALRHRLCVYARPRLLLIDEIGYLSYASRHADLLFEVVSRRYQARDGQPLVRQHRKRN